MSSAVMTEGEGEENKRRTLRERWAGLPRHIRWWWWTGLGLVLAIAVLRQIDFFGCLEALLVLLLVVWGVPTLGWAVTWLWRKLTYRISVRLLISYLLIGVLPFPLLAALAGFGAYILIGQYTSAELGDLGRQVQHNLADLALAAVAADDEEGVAVLDSGPQLPEDLSEVAVHLRWLIAEGADSHRSATAEADDVQMPVPSWMSEGLETGIFLTPLGAVEASIARSRDRIVAVWVPLNPQTSRAFSSDRWFEARFLPETVVVEDRAEGLSLRTGGAESETGGDSEVEVSDEEELLETAMQGEGWWRKRWIFFLRLSPEVRRWEDGELLANRSLPTLLATSPQEALADLFRSPYRVGRAVWGVVLAIGLFFLFVYLGAVALAAILIFNITRSTARLTRGARQVEAGALDYRIPVKRRDQLGDLGAAFNRMAASVQSMLSEVAEKERLKSELQLAREIQESLLPGRLLRHGPLEVHAYFQPAAEVGGDYFDLFPLEPGRLIVAAGDVAGHGLPTGLLMAMVKSAVATLVREGHRGGALLERLNSFMLEQPREHRMLTLALAEIDVPGGTAEITTAAHPPLFLTGTGVEEVMLPALPIGFPWRKPPPSRKLQLEPGSRLVFYSDGLVEAIDEAEEQFGYGRLQEFLREHLELPSEELLAKLLTALEDHTGGRPLDDDLTLLIIDCGTDRETVAAAGEA